MSVSNMDIIKAVPKYERIKFFWSVLQKHWLLDMAIVANKDKILLVFHEELKKLRNFPFKIRKI